MTSSPAFQFYADDFLAGTYDMTPEEVGCYIRLLCEQWNRGSIRLEPESTRRKAGVAVSDYVLSKFDVGADGLGRNKRLELVRSKQASFVESQRLKGVESGKKRAKLVATGVEPGLNRGSIGLQPEGNSPTPTPTPTPCTEETPPYYESVSNLIHIVGSSIYGRTNGQPPGNDEERAALSVVKRKDWKTELETILAFGRTVKTNDRRFEIPKTLLRMLEDWTGSLDKARNYKPHEPELKPNQRNIGIAKNPAVDYVAAAQRKKALAAAELAAQMAADGHHSMPTA